MDILLTAPFCPAIRTGQRLRLGALAAAALPVRPCQQIGDRREQVFLDAPLRGLPAQCHPQRRGRRQVPQVDQQFPYGQLPGVEVPEPDPWVVRREGRFDGPAVLPEESVEAGDSPGRSPEWVSHRSNRAVIAETG